MKTNDKRAKAEQEIQRLNEEVKKTQFVDEIRQREIYNALIVNKPLDIIHNTSKLIDSDVLKFAFPEKPKPYYNMADPYLDNRLFKQGFENEIGGILRFEEKFVPLTSVEFGKNQNEMLEVNNNLNRMEEKCEFD
jgi:hypothetical protein